jgi:hypothetical protein
VTVPVVVRHGRIEGISDLNGQWYATPVETASFRDVADGTYRAVIQVRSGNRVVIHIAGREALLAGPLHCD